MKGLEKQGKVLLYIFKKIKDEKEYIKQVYYVLQNWQECNRKNKNKKVIAIKVIKDVNKEAIVTDISALNI